MITIQTVAPSIGVVLGILLSVLAYVKYDEIGRMMGVGAALVACNGVFLFGLAGTWVGTSVIISASVLAIISGYATERERRRRARA
jgi:NhaP-type Na+/H+ and K+/H+ antiporter